MSPAIPSSPNSRLRMDCHHVEGETDAVNPPPPSFPGLDTTCMLLYCPGAKPPPSGPPAPPDQAPALGLWTCPFHFCGKN